MRTLDEDVVCKMHTLLLKQTTLDVMGYVGSNVTAKIDAQVWMHVLLRIEEQVDEGME